MRYNSSSFYNRFALYCHVTNSRGVKILQFAKETDSTEQTSALILLDRILGMCCIVRVHPYVCAAHLTDATPTDLSVHVEVQKKRGFPPKNFVVTVLMLHCCFSDRAKLLSARQESRIPGRYLHRVSHSPCHTRAPT
jgi:hypothetical protein